MRHLDLQESEKAPNKAGYRKLLPTPKCVPDGSKCDVDSDCCQNMCNNNPDSPYWPMASPYTCQLILDKDAPIKAAYRNQPPRPPTCRPKGAMCVIFEGQNECCDGLTCDDERLVCKEPDEDRSLDLGKQKKGRRGYRCFFGYPPIYVGC